MSSIPGSDARERRQSGAGSPSPIRTSDVLGALSLASDLAVGLPAEHGLRSCLIAMRLAQRLSLPAWEQITVYYTSLLMDAGCTAWTSQIAKRMLTDEIVARRELVFHTDIRNPLRAFSWMWRFLGRGAPLPKRASRFVDFAAHGPEVMREGFQNTCDVARDLAARLGMPEDVQEALLAVFEQWDGGGFPRGLEGRSIPLPCRVVYLAAFFEVFHASGGRDGAIELVRRSRGRSFDPEAVDALRALTSETAFWEALESDESLWPTVMRLEPENRLSWISDEQLTDAAVALADFADMKSAFTLGHSRRVSGTAEVLARRLGLPGEEVLDVRRAALTHDLGLVAVPSFVLHKTQAKLTRAEWEQMRLHPYHGERILANVPALRRAAKLVGAHHERLDGQGYPRGLKDRDIPIGAQLIAASDRFDELIHDAPDRRALAVTDALCALEQDVSKAFSSAVLERLGEELGLQHAVTPVRRQWPASLSDREVEVLQLAARGLSRREMAQKLYVSESTVRTHLEHIYIKIGVSSRAAATLYAVEHDLLN
jgi:HD-GYP domain-containing protein (c-di-GMP phosphodiesterase class II)